MDQFVAQINIFPFNFAPLGWAQCNGQILSISQNTALFSLLGTNYGGNGSSTFGLPNLQGTACLSQGAGPGVSSYAVGQTAGSSSVTLNSTQLPSHTHAVNCYNDGGSFPGPGGNVLGASGSDSRGNVVYSDGSTGGIAAMNGLAVGPAGGGVAHNNMSPYLTLNYCIALQGIFPPRQ